MREAAAIAVDDPTLQRWSDALVDLRQQRETALGRAQQDKAANFQPPDFFDVAASSVEKIIERWFKIQQQAWEKSPPADSGEAIGGLRRELDAVVEFELEAVQRDVERVRGQMTWDEGRRAESQTAFLTVVDEISKRFQIKLDGLLNQDTPRRRLGEVIVPIEPMTQMGYSSSAGGNAMGMALMFVVGLLLGSGPSVYFWNNARQQEQSYQEERTKLLNDQRAIEDGLALLHDNFDQLANGKLRSLPDIENAIHEARANYSDHRNQVNADYTKARERILKKIPAGERQDRSLRDLALEHDKRVASIDSRETAALEPLNKQRSRLKELMVH